jgi:hypothetical protein
VPLKFEDEMTRAHALTQSLRQMLICAQDLEDKHHPVGCAIFLADGWTISLSASRTPHVAGSHRPSRGQTTRDQARWSDPPTPHRLSHELDNIAGLADALAIVSDVEGDRSKRTIGALASEVSRCLDALYAEGHDALDDPTSFLEKRVRK